jgi:hypothetical protein
MEDIKNYKLHTKKVKIITGSTEDIDRKATEFQAAHEIIDIIQKNENTMFIFYWGEENERKIN